MSWFGSKKPDPKEEMKNNTRMLKRNEREMEREISKIEREEEKLKRQIKVAAKKGDRKTASALAKQLVQTRKLKERHYQAKSSIVGVRGKTKAMEATSNMANVMGKTTKVMTNMNQQVNPQQLMQTMEKFNAETMKMDMGEEILDDAFESMFEGEEEECDDLVGQIFTEVGLDITGKMNAVPTTPVQSQQTSTPTATKTEEDDLLARLAML
eukprot:m.9638 g.9638  ORF g.9638 m.9638 type:complete len:211 (+) comp6388_c0_seq2:209-841(+)